ncbi:MAG: nucleotidyltransferase family protein [Deltaproteobacteria bacterium]|nr:nucleotidyltransferase family protein [Deltaproteobacteria bacterium]
MTPATLGIPLDQLREYCERNGIRKLSVFGSAVRGELTPGSDVDVLVELDPDRHIGLLRFVEIEQELSALFGGRKIDLATELSLSPYIRDDVIRRAETLYAAG